MLTIQQAYEILGSLIYKRSFLSTLYYSIESHDSMIFDPLTLTLVISHNAIGMAADSLQRDLR